MPKGPETGYGFRADGVDPVAFFAQATTGDGCWEWQGTRVKGRGYGKVRYPAPVGRVSAHRLAYALAHGEVPHYVVIRHTCDNPSCVRPDHLVAGTQADNVADKMQRGRYRSGQAAKTHCPHGHPYAGDNLMRLKNGRRKCRACHTAASRDYYARKTGKVRP